MEQNKRQKAAGRYRSNVVYLLSGVIWCGECGKRMIGTSSSYKTRLSQEHRKLYYYECNYAKRTKECRNEKINKEKAEEYVLTKLKNDILNDRSIPVLAQELYEYYQNDKQESSGEGEWSGVRGQRKGKECSGSLGVKKTLGSPPHTLPFISEAGAPTPAYMPFFGVFVHVIL